MRNDESWSRSGRRRRKRRSDSVWKRASLLDSIYGATSDLSTEKVSQALGSPSSNPCRNQDTRCSDDPWVHVSGDTSAPGSGWMRSSPTAAAAEKALFEIALHKQLPFVGSKGPHAGHAVRLQLHANRELVRVAGRFLLLPMDPPADAQKVLDVMADLMSQYVGLREISRCPKASAQLTEEAEIE